MLSCVNCGSTLPRETAVCGACGFVVAGATMDRSPEPPRLKPRRPSSDALQPALQPAQHESDHPAAPLPDQWPLQPADDTAAAPAPADLPAVTGTFLPEPSVPGAAGRTRGSRVALVVVMVLALLAGAVLVVVRTSADNDRVHTAGVEARTAAGRSCVREVIAGEQAVGAGSQAVAAVAGLVADAPKAKPDRVNRSVDAVAAAQQPGRVGLSRCAQDPLAPAACVHSATVLLDAARRQEEQAATIAKIAAAARSNDKDEAAKQIVVLTGQRTDLRLVVADVGDTLCGQTAGVDRP